jgi:hypothetical protein
MRRTPRRPSPTWRSFLAVHARDIIAVDFFLVPTLIFRLFIVFVVLRHDRRELIHVNVTDPPTALWTARQIVEAFPTTRPRGTCSVIETEPKATTLGGKSSAWGSARSSPSRGRLGRTHSWSG